MTSPSITYGHGFLTDCTATTEKGVAWAETESGLPSALTVLSGDIFKIEGTCDNVADEYAYYEYDLATNLSTDTFTKYLVLFKTSAASSGLQAKIEFVFTVGSQLIELGFSTSWTTATGTVTAGKTLDKVRLYADDDADAVAAGTFQVYYDFVLVYKNNFSFPHADVEAMALSNQWARLVIPGRDGPVKQFVGADDYKVKVSGDMANWETWGSGSGASQAFGEYLLRLYLEAHNEPFNWFSSDLVTQKFSVDRLALSKDKDRKSPRSYTFDLSRYSLSSLSDTNWD